MARGNLHSIRDSLMGLSLIQRFRVISSGVSHTEIGKAYTGKYDDTTGALFRDPAIGLAVGEIWVRRNGSRHATRARNVGGKAPLNLTNVAVSVGLNRTDGLLDVLEVDWQTAIDQFGENVYSATRARGVVPSRELEPGRVYLAAAGTLQFRAKPFLFRDDAGDRREWLDLITSAVTASNTTSSGEHQVIVIALDNDATTPALTTVNSTPVSTSVSLTRENALAVALTDGFIPLAAAHVYYGDTTVRGDEYLWDLRPWLEGSGTGGTTSPLTTKGDLYTFDTDNARLPVGSEGQYLRARAAEATGMKWESVSVGSGLTVTKVTREMHVPLYYNLLGSSGKWDIDLSAISGALSCRHLIIRGEFRSDRAGVAGDNMWMFANNDTTASNYRGGNVFGGSLEGGDVFDTAQISTTTGGGSPANYFVPLEGIILHFGNTTREKRAFFLNIDRRDATNIYAHHNGWTWESTAAITRLTFNTANGASNNFTAGSWLEIIGVIDEEIVTDVSGGMAEYSTANVSNPPTDAELDSAFGTPADLGAGFVGLVNDNGSGANYWQVMSTGSKWVYVAMTEAT